VVGPVRLGALVDLREGGRLEDRRVDLRLLRPALAADGVASEQQEQREAGERQRQDQDQPRHRGLRAASAGEHQQGDDHDRDLGQ
jgi:hypothetical protein